MKNLTIMIKINFINRKVNNTIKVYCRVIVENVVLTQISTNESYLNEARKIEIKEKIKILYSNDFLNINEIKKIINGNTENTTINCLINNFTEENITKKSTSHTKRSIKSKCQNMALFFKNNNLKLILQVSPNVLNEYERFLLKQDKKPSTIQKNVSIMRRFFSYCFSKGFIKNNYGAGYICETKMKHEINYLSFDELKKIEKCNIAQTRLNRIKLLFLLQCYTGLAYIDLMDLNESKFERKNGDIWLTGVRAKSGQTYFVPVEKKASILWGKLGQKIEQISNQKYNSYLKEIADIAGVKTRITTHTGRRTFGMIQLNTGYAIEDVSRMLGHNNISTTQKHYAKVLNERIIISRRNLQKIS